MKSELIGAISTRPIVAALLGALILSLMSVPAAIVGQRTRLSSYMIIEHTFGYAGAKFVNFWFGVFLLGWYAVTAELFGRTLYLAAGELISVGIQDHEIEMPDEGGSRGSLHPGVGHGIPGRRPWRAPGHEVHPRHPGGSTYRQDRRGQLHDRTSFTAN